MKIRMNPWREVAVLMIIIMEVSWITPWFRSLTPQTYAIEPWRLLFTIGSIVLSSYIIFRFMDFLMLKRNIQQIAMVIFLVAGCYLGIKILLYAHESVPLNEFLLRPLRSFADLRNMIPVEFIIIFTVLIGFWRGVTLAQEHIGPSAVMSHFWIGIVMYIIFIFLITIVTGETAGDFFFLFLFSALIGVSAARITVISLVRGGRKVEFERSWFVGIVLAALSIAGMAFLISSFLGHNVTELGTLFLGLFGSLIILVWIILSPILSFLIKLISDLFSDSQLVMNLGTTLQNLNGMIGRLGQMIQNKLESTGIGAFFARLAPILKTIVLSGILIIVVGVIVAWMTIRLIKEREKRLTDNEEKTKLIPDHLLQALLDLMKRQLSNVKDSFVQIIDFRHKQRIRAAARIRQIYSDFLELCEMVGLPRPSAFTPMEFAPRILTIFPEYQSEINTLTQAYVKVRYGLLPETQSEIIDVEDAWLKINSAGRELLQLKHKKSKA